MTPVERAREAAAEAFRSTWLHKRPTDAIPTDSPEAMMKLSAGLDAFLSHLASEGLVLVPKEATEEMCRSEDARVWLIEPERFKDQCAARVWAAMIAASPHHLHKQQSNKPEAGEEG